MIVDVTSDGHQRTPTRWRAFFVGGPLAAEQRRWRLRRFGVLALLGLVLGLAGLLMSALVPRGSAVHGLAAAFVGLGMAMIAVAGLAVGGDRFR